MKLPSPVRAPPKRKRWKTSGRNLTTSPPSRNNSRNRRNLQPRKPRRTPASRNRTPMPSSPLTAQSLPPDRTAGKTLPLIAPSSAATTSRSGKPASEPSPRPPSFMRKTSLKPNAMRTPAASPSPSLENSKGKPPPFTSSIATTGNFISSPAGINSPSPEKTASTVSPPTSMKKTLPTPRNGRGMKTSASTSSMNRPPSRK